MSNIDPTSVTNPHNTPSAGLKELNLFLLAKRLHKAFYYSNNGFKHAYKTQWAFRFELALMVLAFPAAYCIAYTVTDFILMMMSIILLPILELLNTGIETTVNRISFEFHELSGLAKDLGSSALFFAGGQAIFVWGIYLGSRLLNMSQL